MNQTRARDTSLLRQKQDHLERTYVDVARDDQVTFFARPYVEGHIRTTLNRLRAAYLQVYQVEDDSPDRGWFQEMAESLDGFATTFPARSRVLPLGSAAMSLRSFVQFPAILWLVGFTGLGSWVAETAGSCACHIIGLSTGVAVIWIAISMVGGFTRKRRVFLKYDVYRSEADVLRLLDCRPRVELQMDVLGLALTTLLFSVAALLDRIVGVRIAFGLDRARVFLVLAGVSLLGFVVVGLASTRREWAWGRSGSPATENRS